MEAPPVRGTIQGTLDDEASIPKACGPWGFHPKLGLNGILLREKLVYDCGTSRCTLLHYISYFRGIWLMNIQTCASKHVIISPCFLTAGNWVIHGQFSIEVEAKTNIMM